MNLKNGELVEKAQKLDNQKIKIKLGGGIARAVKKSFALEKIFKKFHKNYLKNTWMSSLQTGEGRLESKLPHPPQSVKSEPTPPS